MIAYSNIPETNLDIPLADGKKIHSIVRGELNGDAPIVIMMHGRPGNGNELLQYLGARYFYECGITTLRLSMYDYGENYRSIFDCTLDTHISDFEDVVRYVRALGSRQIFALGHSYGGMTILGSDTRLDGAVLWDPAHGLAWNNSEFDSADYPEKVIGDFIIGVGGNGYVYPSKQKTYDEALGDTTHWAAGKDYPTKYILASAGPLAAYAKRYYEVATAPKELVEIADAHHQFEDNDEVVEQLLHETAAFVTHYSQSSL